MLRFFQHVKRSARFSINALAFTTYNNGEDKSNKPGKRKFSISREIAMFLFKGSRNFFRNNIKKFLIKLECLA